MKKLGIILLVLFIGACSNTGSINLDWSIEDNIDSNGNVDDFSSENLRGFWRDFHKRYYNENGQLIGKKSGILIYNDIFEETNYLVETDLFVNPKTNGTLGLIFGEDEDGDFYSAKLKPGKWGKVIIYMHTESYDYGGKFLVSSQTMYVDKLSTHRLSIDVNETVVKISLNGKLIIEFESKQKFYNSSIGYVNIGDQYRLIKADNFNYQSR